MTNVPQYPVLRSVEDVVKSDGELDDAEARAQVAPGFRDVEDDIWSHFIC